MSTSQNSWKLADPKARFSELFRKARAEGPQRVTRSGRETVVVLDEEDYERLKGPGGKDADEESLFEFFSKSPLVGLDLDFSRAPDSDREVDLRAGSCSTPTCFLKL